MFGRLKLKPVTVFPSRSPALPTRSDRTGYRQRGARFALLLTLALVATSSAAEQPSQTTFRPRVTRVDTLPRAAQEGLAGFGIFASGFEAAEASAGIAACPADLSTPLLDALPIESSAYLALRPLGFITHPIHMIPAKHHAFAIALPGSVAQKTVVRAPARAWVKEIIEVSFSSGGGNFQVFVYPCNEVRLYFGHLDTLSQRLLDAIASNQPTCTSFMDGNGTTTTCRHTQLSIPLASAEVFGTGPDTVGIDFGANDTRLPPAGFIRPDHYSFDYPYYASPLNYFTAEPKAALQAKLGSVFGDFPRTMEPREGSFAQDIAGRAAGNWFNNGVTHRSSTDLRSALALVHDYVDPGQPLISMGSSVPGLGSGVFSFTPRSSGVINREFAAISADGKIYCYEAFLSGRSAGGIGLANPRGTLLVAMPSADSLTVERQGTDGSACGPEGTYAFTTSSALFER